MENIHQDHNQWMSQINFLKDELGFLIRLIEILPREILQGADLRIIDEYLSCFIQRKQEVEGMIKNIREEETEILKVLKDESSKVFPINQHISLRNHLRALEKSHKEDKAGFYGFIETHHIQLINWKSH